VVSELALGTFQPSNPEYRFSGLTWPAFSAWTLSLLILAAATMFPTFAKHRGALLLLAAAALAGLLLTRTRAGAAGLAVGLAAYAALTWPVRRTLMAGLALVVVTAACLLALELTAGNVGDRVNDAVNFGRADTAEGVSGRWQLWQDLAPFVSARPITGYGYDSFWTPDRLVQIGSDNWGAPDAHNGYLNLTLGVGLIGAAAYALVLLAGLGRACLRYRATGSVEFVFAACVILVLAINTGFVSTQLSPALYSFITLVLLAHLGFIDDPSTGRISPP
jgi:exopolysaccharide production protein ExoQ